MHVIAGLIILIREIAVSGLREFLGGLQVSVPVSKLAKWKTTFQLVSLGSLILALGLLVDDAIIAIEMMVVKMEEGYDRVAASAYAWSHTAAPMLSVAITAAPTIPTFTFTCKIITRTFTPTF